MQRLGIVRLAFVNVLWMLFAFGCSSHPHEQQQDDPAAHIQSLHKRQVAAGQCPDGQRPTISAPAIGLTASKTYGEPGKKDDSAIVDARCLIDPISFVVPGSLPITKGDAGKGRATLSFRDTSSGNSIECEYRGTSKHKERSDRYELHKCGSKISAGQTKTSDWFRLEVESANNEAGTGTTEIRLELGTPSASTSIEVVSADPKLGDATLAIPPGAASPFEHFSLEVLDQTEPKLPLNYGHKSTIAGAYGVHVRAPERGDGAALPPSSTGAHFKLTMSYDPAVLTSLNAQEKDLMILEVAKMHPWSFPEILAVRKDFTIDTTNHTLTLNADRAVGYLSAVARGTRRIPYNNGSVMKGHVPIHLLYYGTVTSYQRTLLEDFIRDLAGSPWLGILDSYNDSQAARPTTDIALGQTFTVASPNLNPPLPNTDWVETTIRDAIDQRNLPSDGNAIYLVIAGNDTNISATDNATTTIQSCGWHTSRSPGLFQATRKFGLIKNTTLTPTSGCRRFRVGTGNGTTSPNREVVMDSMLSTVAHEIVETLTNPDVEAGWVAELGAGDVENADNCSGFWEPSYTAFFNGPGNTDPVRANVKLGIRNFLIQQNWVNIGNGYGYCALRIENDDARVSGMSTTLPEPPAGQFYHPMIYGGTYTANIDYQNTGDTNWRDLGAAGEQYLLGSQTPEDNDNFGVGGRVSTGAPTVVITRGNTHRFTFAFNPQTMFPGLDYIFQWRMVREAVRWFGESTPEVIVRAMFDSSAIGTPPIVPSLTQADDAFSVQVTFRNTSGAAWRPQDGYSLRVTAGSFAGGTTRVDLGAGESIEPGGSKTFSVPLTAPHTPGSYSFRAQMQHDGIGTFGPELAQSIEVTPSDRGEFEAQSVPDLLMAMWSTYNVRATFRNTGTATWGPGYRLVINGPFHMVSTVPMTTSVPPGASYEFSGTVSPDDFPYNQLPLVGFFQLGLANPAGRRFADAAVLGVTIRSPLEVLATCVDPGFPSTVVAGQTYRARTVVKNRGETTWQPSFGLASTPPGDRKWGVSFVPLNQTLAPNATHTFEYDVVAPTTLGQQQYFLMMAQESTAQNYIFDPCQVDVTVVATLSDGATYQANVPDVSNFCSKQPMISCYRQELLCYGRRYNVPVPITMLNSGGTTWTKSGGFFLSVTDTSWGVDRVDLSDSDSIAPGQSKTFTFDPTAPFTFGERQLHFQMSHGATKFGDATPTGVAQLIAGCGG